MDTEEKTTEENEPDICGSQDYSQDVWEEDLSNDSSDEVKPVKILESTRSYTDLEGW